MHITDTQHAILELVATRIARDGMPPSQTEIAAAMGFSSVRAAQYHLEALEQAGAIRKVPGKARGLRLTEIGLAALGQGVGDGEGGGADVAPAVTTTADGTPR